MTAGATRSTLLFCWWLAASWPAGCAAVRPHRHTCRERDWAGTFWHPPVFSFVSFWLSARNAAKDCERAGKWHERGLSSRVCLLYFLFQMHHYTYETSFAVRQHKFEFTSFVISLYWGCGTLCVKALLISWWRFVLNWFWVVCRSDRV